MVKHLLLDQLKIKKATQNEWKEILNLLDESKMTFWLLGNEGYENFFIVKNSTANDIICCFAIDIENEAGILRSFTIRKNLQGKGLGSYIVNNLIPEISKELKIKTLFSFLKKRS